MAVLTTESWTGSNGASWPASPNTWAFNGAAGTIQSNRGQMQAATGAYVSNQAHITSLSVADVDVIVDVTWPGTIVEQYVGLTVRNGGTYVGFAPVIGYFINWGSDGGWTLRRGLNDGAGVILGTGQTQAVVAGATYRMRLRAAGSTISAKIWRPGTEGEPGTWEVSVTDSTFTAAGYVGVLNSNGNATNGISQFDDLEVSDAEVPPQTAIELREAGTATLAAAAVTAINPVVPASTTTGDLSVLTVAMKPFGTTVTTPAGWTKIGEDTNGTVANSAADLGSTKVAVFVRESATPGAIGNMTFGGSPNTIGAVIHSYSKPPASTWDYSQFTTGGDTTNGANYLATGAAGIDVAVGDWVVAGTAVNGDIGTVTVPTIGGMAGATLDTVGVRTPGTNAVGGGAITTGFDCRVIVVDRKVTAGSSNAAPTFTYTNASNTSGTSLWVRLRAVAPAVTLAQWIQKRTAIRRASNW